MMKTHISTTLLLSLLASSLILLGSGCSKKIAPPEATAGADGSGMSSQGDGAYSEDSLPIEGTLDDTSGANGMADGDMSDAYKMAHGRSTQGLSPIYFDFDSASVRPDMVEPMLQNAEYLKQMPNAYVVVEGNTDETGTNEYNLALGERRAQNTKQYLVDLGINEVRIRTVSYGEERPLFEGSGESVYQYNRRADFVVE